MKLLVVSRDDGTIVSLTVSTDLAGAHSPGVAAPHVGEGETLDEGPLEGALRGARLVDIAAGYQVLHKGDKAMLVPLAPDVG